ncbi:TolC family protein [Synechococcus sp. BIOS-E4-1]|uniref:TolC family protein n=1 Tax=Synechococcus sp. BIOS-E4-1 TaxID=1400864 RepID=UPI001644874B|nr:TolC family protein [Synechococcus sp. BIOS-E4-1]
MFSIGYPFSSVDAQAAELVPTVQANPGTSVGQVSGQHSLSAEQQADQLLARLNAMRDKIDKSARKISLDEAIALGIRNNPELVSAFRSIQDYEWQLIAAQRQWYPTFAISNGSPTLGLDVGTYITKFYNDPFRTSVSTTPGSAIGTEPTSISQYTNTLNFQPNASISWNFIDPTRQPDINAASEALRQQKLLFEVSARDLILNIQTSYFALQSTRQLIEEFYNIYDINRQLLEVNRARYEIRLVSMLALAQTQTQLYNQLNQLLGYTKQFIEESATLAMRLGLPVDKLVLPDEKANLYRDWSKTLPQTIDRAVESREEILASLAAAEEARWDGISKINSYLPIVLLYGEGGLSMASGVINGSPGLDNARSEQLQTQWNAAVGLGFEWTWDGGVDAAAARSDYAQEEMERSKAEMNRLQAVQQVRSSFGQYETSRVAVDSARLAYQSAQVAQEAARARYEIGLGDITSIVQTIEQLGTASISLSDSILNYNRSVAQLYRYSATWPGESDQLVRQQEKSLR